MADFLSKGLNFRRVLCPQFQCFTVLLFIYMCFFDNKKHHKPHVHAQYAEHKASFSIDEGELLDGALPKKQLKMVQAWMAIHEEDLKADWQ